jgi:hypothetical protein
MSSILPFHRNPAILDALCTNAMPIAIFSMSQAREHCAKSQNTQQQAGINQPEVWFPSRMCDCIDLGDCYNLNPSVSPMAGTKIPMVRAVNKQLTKGRRIR